MDDLATTERSRWEVWAEVYHGRVSKEQFETWLKEEAQFIKNNQDSSRKKIQVRWTGEAAEWYPIAVQIVHQLITDPNPVEFVSELLLPFSLQKLRDSQDPWDAANQYHSKYRAYGMAWLN